MINLEDEMIYLEEEKLWWPKDDAKISAVKFLYEQAKNIDAAMTFCKGIDVVLQAGGHVGVWPIELSKRFSIVRTFEPSWVSYMCLKRNLNNANCENVVTHPEGLGSECKEVMFYTEANSQKNSLIKRDKSNGSFGIKIITIDSLDLNKLDLIILDTEGTEYDILVGARNTILKFKPVIMLENWNNQPLASEKFLKEELGYRMVHRANKDNIFKT